MRGRTSRRARCCGLALLAALAVAGCRDAPPERSVDGVVLVVVDTLRADHLGLHGAKRPTSPNIDEFAEDALVFDRAYAPSPWTAPSMGTLFTGEWPSRHRAGELKRNDRGQIVLKKGRKVFAKPDRGLPMLAETLSTAGFETAAIVTNVVLTRGSGFERGFDTFAVLGPDATAPQVTRRALAWLDRRTDDRPFFLWIHYFDPHLPYDAPEPFGDTFSADLSTQLETPVAAPQKVRARAGELTRGDRRYLRAVYDEEVRYLDAGIGLLIEGLEERGLADRTLFVLTSDHGEELLDHGGFEHGHALHHELIHVPLLLRAPGWIEPGRADAPVSLRDVHATILDAALPGEPSGGRRLAGPREQVEVHGPSPVLLESMLYGHDRLGLIDWPYKWTRGPRGDERLFDLENDPREQRPLELTGGLAERAQRMRATAEAMRDESRAAGPAREDRALDAETRLQLGVLGYLEES